MDTQPYDLNALAGGAVRILYAPISEPVPENLSDVFKQTAPYTPVGTWKDLGATSGPFAYARNLTTAGYTIEQEQTQVLESVTELTRTFAAPVAELRPDTLVILEEGKTVAQAGASGVGKATHIQVGSIGDLSAYRLCFVATRQRQQGEVKESAGAGAKVRGRFLGFIAYRGQMTGESASMSFGKGALASIPLTFKLGPEPLHEEHGFWVDEEAGTIAA